MENIKSIINIYDVALMYINEKEIKNNMGFDDKNFQKKLEIVGWLVGQAWCNYFAELVVKDFCYHFNLLEHYKTIDKLFTGSSTQTFKNFQLNNNNYVNKLFSVSSKPQINSIGIFRHGLSWQGHTVIIGNIVANSKYFTIEGNTNDNGSREGIKVCQKIRNFNKPFQKNGLNFIGSIKLNY